MPRRLALAALSTLPSACTRPPGAPATGRVLTVARGESLARVLAAAADGDTVALEPGDHHRQAAVVTHQYCTLEDHRLLVGIAVVALAEQVQVILQTIGRTLDQRTTFRLTLGHCRRARIGLRLQTRRLCGARRRCGGRNGAGGVGQVVLDEQNFVGRHTDGGLQLTFNPQFLVKPSNH